jgi:hypothetical protein
MTTKEFAELAINNGYTNNHCEGWDWIRENLSKLDYIFRTKEYERCDGMKYKCMPLILGEIREETPWGRALSAAWYLNNERVAKEKAEQRKNEMTAKGYKKLDWSTETENELKKLDGHKIEVVAEMSSDWLSVKADNVYKVKWVEHKSSIYLMKPKARSRGYSLYQFEDAFYKVI